MLAGCGDASSGKSSATATPTPTRTPAIAAARLPVTLTVHPDGQVSPHTVSVPARLPIQLTVRNRTPSPLSVTMEHVPAGLGVPPGKSASERLDALPKGRYEVRVRGAGSATVIVGAAPGP